MTRTVEQLKADAAEAGRDPQTRRLLFGMALVALMSLLVAVFAGISAWKTASDDAQAGQNLASQVRAACEADEIDAADVAALCDEAVQVEKAIPGEAGAAGDVGLTGPEGPIGPPGPFGATGEQGLTGPRGDTGPRGTGGNTGANGSTGTPGEDGSTGASGAPGEDGSAGQQGPPGEQGLQGEPGADGAGAFPFSFRFTAQTSPTESTTYTVTCRQDGCAVESSSTP